MGMLWGEHVVTQQLNFVWGYTGRALRRSPLFLARLSRCAQRLSHQPCWSPRGAVTDTTEAPGSLSPSRGWERHSSKKVVQFKCARFALNCRVYDALGI